MTHRFGLFDVDTREMDESGQGLAYRPRVRPIVPQLERLYALAEAKSYPVVFTTCCSGRMPTPQALPDTLFIPLDGSDTSWCGRLRSHRQFYLAKLSHGNPRLNLACRAYDMFRHNGNASRLARELAVQTWVVFGNAFDLCVASAAAGLLRARLALIVLEDVRVSSAQGDPQSEAATLRTLRDQGARVLTLETFVRFAEGS